MIEQLSIWEGVKPYFKIDKPIRLIELFAGIGSQHEALKRLGFKIDRTKICEWSIQSTQAYNDIHIQDYTNYTGDLTKDELVEHLAKKGISGNWNEPMTLQQLSRKPREWLAKVYNNIIATRNIVDIQRISGDDLNIENVDKYIYIMTYSFPCQDLSLAGNRQGMARGDSTRSGLLWEVERLLKETKHLPHILLMENVPEVIGTNNISHFQEWELFLRNLGYSNYCEILNAKDYGIPQNRNRAFMVSILGDYLYSFPQKQELQLRLKDMLEDDVDEKYYLSESIMKNYFLKEDAGKFNRKERFIANISRDNDIGNTITTRSGDRPTDNFVIIPEATKQGYALAGDGDGIYINRPHQKRGVVQKQMIQTIKTDGDDVGVVVKENLKAKMAEQLIEQGKVREYDVIRHSYTNSRIKGEMKDIQDNNISPTIDTRADCLGVAVKTWNNETKAYKTKESDMPRDRIYETESIGFTITTIENQQPFILQDIKQNLRIRKLTPKECFRLMGFHDEAIDRAGVNQSNSSMYHLAGDSIVVDVLEAIFKQFKV